MVTIKNEHCRLIMQPLCIGVGTLIWRIHCNATSWFYIFIGGLQTPEPTWNLILLQKTRDKRNVSEACILNVCSDCVSVTYWIIVRGYRL